MQLKISSNENEGGLSSQWNEWSKPGQKPVPRWKQVVKTANPRVDPYLIWFDLTYEAPPDIVDRLLGGARIEVLLELPLHAVASVAHAEAYLAKLKAYGFVARNDGIAHNRAHRFVTGQVQVRHVQRLAEDVAAGCIDVLFELASPKFIASADADPATTVPSKAKPGQARTLSFADPAAAPPAVPRKRQPPVPAVPAPLVVVVDDFCNYASVGASGRILSIWYQGMGAAQSSQSNQRMPFSGSEDPNAEDYGLVVEFDSPAQGLGRPVDPARRHRPDEAQAYGDATGGSLARRHQLPPRWSHGSAVLSMMWMQDGRGDNPSVQGAGLPMTNPDCRRGDCEPPHAPDGLGQLEVPEGVDFIQLPEPAVLDTSGGSLAGFALDAIHRAVKRAVHMLRPSVIVNLSYGTHSGPHDGTSMFERALLELLSLNDGRPEKIDGEPHRRTRLHVVLPAGNTHLERTHASAWLPSKGSSREVKWIIQPDTDSDSYLEIWIGEDARSDVVIELEPPGGVPIEPLGPGDMQVLTDSVDESVLRAAVIYPKTTSRGQKGTLALIAVGPTQRRAKYGYGETYRMGGDDLVPPDASNPLKDSIRRRRIEAPSGCWTVRLTNRGDTAVQVHAWVQRHDAAPGRRRARSGYQGRQSYLLEAPGTPTDPCFTLNGIATATCHDRLWVVGAMDERGGIPLYSAAGPDRRVGARFAGPDVAVTVDRSRNVPGRLVGGNFSASKLRLGGTSISAAAFTRMLYHTLLRKGAMAWCDPETPAPAPVLTADTPHVAQDRLRGALVRLRHVCDLAIPCKPGTTAHPSRK